MQLLIFAIFVCRSMAKQGAKQRKRQTPKKCNRPGLDKKPKGQTKPQRKPKKSNKPSLSDAEPPKKTERDWDRELRRLVGAKVKKT